MKTALNSIALVVIAILFAYSPASYAQGMMGGSMQHMQNMGNMQQMMSMQDMMQHMQTMNHELSGMMQQMSGDKGMGKMSGEGMNQNMSMMQEMQKLGTNMQSLIEQMSKTMADKGMMADPKMKNQMMQMQKHMGSLVNDYHEMMQNLKKEQSGSGK